MENNGYKRSTYFLMKAMNTSERCHFLMKSNEYTRTTPFPNGKQWIQAIDVISYWKTMNTSERCLAQTLHLVKDVLTFWLLWGLALREGPIRAWAQEHAEACRGARERAGARGSVRERAEACGSVRKRAEACESAACTFSTRFPSSA